MTDGHSVMPRERLDNLIDSATPYTPAGGRVTVRAPVEPGIASDDTGENRRIHLEAEDAGPGIPVHEHGRVLERVYRILGRDGESSGPGLAIVAQHGGMPIIENPAYQAAPHLVGALVCVGFVPRRTARE